MASTGDRAVNGRKLNASPYFRVDRESLYLAGVVAFLTAPEFTDWDDTCLSAALDAAGGWGTYRQGWEYARIHYAE